jgi:hypothetical protein
MIIYAYTENLFIIVGQFEGTGGSRRGKEFVKFMKMV